MCVGVCLLRSASGNFLTHAEHPPFSPLSVLYRDVKPDNILLDERGETLDFLARRWRLHSLTKLRCERAARLKEASFECWAIIGSLLPVLGHAHLTDFNIATIIKDGERATALAGTKPYMGTGASPPKRPLMTRLLVSFLSEADPIFASLRREEVV